MPETATTIKMNEYRFEKLTWEELEAKFRSLAGAVLSAEQCDAIIRQIETGRASCASWPVPHHEVPEVVYSWRDVACATS